MAEFSNPGPMVKKCCIIGLGLIGGSYGLALGKYGIASERWGYDVDSTAMETAKKKKAVDDTGPLEEALKDADLVVLATPVGRIPAILEQIAPLLGKNTLVTDVGSSKRAVVDAMKKMPAGIICVGGHPMAGSEFSGIEASNGDLFQEAVYFLTPDGDLPEEMLLLMENIVGSMGARPVIITAREHDRIMAPLSHLPKLVSAALVNVLGRYSANAHELLDFAGPGFRDTTRIAAGDPLLWLDIFANNKDNMRYSLNLLMEELQAMADYLEQADWDALSASLQKAASLRRFLSPKNLH